MCVLLAFLITGMCMLMAGHSTLWTVTMAFGFWEGFISIMIIATAFLALCLCLSEMISILPFGGTVESIIVFYV